jgi:DNA ligase (NAD+)
VKLPQWLEDETFPAHLREAAREAGEEVLAIESVPEDVREAVGRIRTVLILWAWEYYRGEPSVTDEVNDAAMTYLKRREGRYPELITPLSPTQRVGYVIEKK